VSQQLAGDLLDAEVRDGGLPVVTDTGTKQMRKTTAINGHQRVPDSTLISHLGAMGTVRQVLGRLCKQEVTGSIPVGSTELVCAQTTGALTR
jgi:hypothetical protein